ncbi:glutamine-hydrolyzing carbamoyl-phosphate synthase small subunit [Methanothermobacter wolfeii]|uniref:Carbamoyl phosphate synthase small chain n=1 Tax=Methanothermobacter wolfeii TaxID=145261 RepID=A0A9E7UMV1_METWO|nr:MULTISPECIES: glutamine-hydrolyzing carbamoyl-phosphate synthase small subunit [Methanothermobacter]NLM02750.1 glutamine-hydrolyzing carbamoyl-phosphate synthase small subunit [Methanothermobacter wolfeii]QHN06739.1 glutamine-hydrolyzing carbamoyl-phosphate synthase small subunit [Methanothermobacter sp. THM-1]UXH31281.1 glutamine-hydrolyzing carbamoyl-phosphate synthase small subunit [Methanothermobacter wolfeii]SCM58003.1 Carbamoyl-phosphate synthase small chain {ECO:0000255/HAMAP-Rule:MF_
MFKEAKLALEDGTILRGEAFGFETVTTGEVVFATGMTGYVESLTDPSYKGQILMPTYPLQGNYGVSEEWYQSDGIKAEGLIVREECRAPSHELSQKTLSEFLEEYRIPGISGIDTRALTIKIRDKGAMKGALATEEIDDEELLELAVNQPDITEIDLVDKVCVKEPVFMNEDAGRRVVIVDCGIKRNSINALLRRDVGVVIVPYTMEPEEIMDHDPDALLISSGPGDPTRVREAIEAVKRLSSRLPVFGICLGQQIISLAFGARIYKMKFGHRGVNQPVKDLRTGEVSITSQNHGFTVDPSSVEGTDIEITQMNLNDKTPEAIEHRELPVFSVQYHPEAGPGPHDTDSIFDRFVNVMKEY